MASLKPSVVVGLVGSSVVVGGVYRTKPTDDWMAQAAMCFVIGAFAFLMFSAIAFLLVYLGKWVSSAVRSRLWYK